MTNQSEIANRVLSMKRLGITYSEIGKKLGFSHQRAVQHVLKQSTGENAASGVCSECGLEKTRLHRHHDSYECLKTRLVCPSCHMSISWKMGQIKKGKTGRKPIQDQFTHLKLSKQRKWQLRHDAKGLCQICNRPKAEGMVRCEEHVIEQRETQRKRNRATKRYHGSRSYQL